MLRSSTSVWSHWSWRFPLANSCPQIGRSSFMLWHRDGCRFLIVFSVNIYGGRREDDTLLFFFFNRHCNIIRNHKINAGVIINNKKKKEWSYGSYPARLKLNSSGCPGFGQVGSMHLRSRRQYATVMRSLHMLKQNTKIYIKWGWQ